MSPGSGAWRWLRALLLGLATVVVLVEEWGWRPLSTAIARLTAWGPFGRLEALVRRAPPRVALVLFAMPAVALFPLKLAALALIAAGHAVLGIGLVVGAKLLGTAIVGRLYVLLEPQLLTFAWLAAAIGWWTGWKGRILARVRASRAWRSMRRLAADVPEGWRRLRRDRRVGR